jgi:hypothetical protein
MDAPMACHTRNPIRLATLGDKQLKSEPSANMVNPIRNTLRLPTRSPRAPLKIIMDDKTNKYASITHCKVVTDGCNDRLISASARLTLVLFKFTRNMLVQHSSNPIFNFRGSDVYTRRSVS